MYGSQWPVVANPFVSKYYLSADAPPFVPQASVSSSPEETNITELEFNQREEQEKKAEEDRLEFIKFCTDNAITTIQSSTIKASTGKTIEGNDAWINFKYFTYFNVHVYPQNIGTIIHKIREKFNSKIAKDTFLTKQSTKYNYKENNDIDYSFKGPKSSRTFHVIFCHPKTQKNYKWEMFSV